MAVRHETISGGSVRLLVPEVDAPTALKVSFDVGGEQASLETTLRPPRHFEVHIVHHTHLDIGYTDRQHVVRAQHLSYLDDVLRLVRETDGLSDDARFRWNEEALFSVEDWFANRPAAARDELLRRVAENRISLSAMPFNLHTETCSTDELHELLRERPRRSATSTASTSPRPCRRTSPGRSSGCPTPCSRRSACATSPSRTTGRAARCRTSQGAAGLPRLFRWRTPAGGAVVVWRTDTPHGLAYMEGPMVGLTESYDVASRTSCPPT